MGARHVFVAGGIDAWKTAGVLTGGDRLPIRSDGATGSKQERGAWSGRSGAEHLHHDWRIRPKRGALSGETGLKLRLYRSDAW
jgi:hypothetical protein